MMAKDPVDSLKKQSHMHCLVKRAKNKKKCQRNGQRKPGKLPRGIVAPNTTFPMPQSKPHVAKQEERRQKGARPGSLLHAEEVTSTSLSVYHLSYSRHALALTIMEKRKN